MRIRLLVCLCLIAATIAPAQSDDQQTQTAQKKGRSKLAPWVVEHTQDGKQAEFLIVLEDRADLSGAALLKTKREKGRFVYSALWRKAQETQGSLLSWLESSNIDHRSYYIVNMISFFALGAWHALLQGAVPFLLARRGDWRSWAATLAAVLIFWLAGNWLVAKLKFRGRLAIVWLVYGAVLIGLPFVFGGEPARYLDTWTARFIAAVLFGSLMSCVSLGWYFAVSLAFNGHNEQAGGAARIERFKEFMRVRLTAHSLTAYVIGFDEPKMHGHQLRPRIIDVFELKV